MLRHGRPITSETVGEVLPIGTVLTLPATGSEMNSGAVISYDHGKFPVMSPLTFPRFSVLDPTVTFTLPKKQVANGIVDSFVHTTEQYITYPVDAMVQDRIAEGILQTLIEIGPVSVAEPENYDARANHEWSAKLLQYAERVWHIEKGGEEEMITAAIGKTREFFESLGIPTHLSDYGVGADKIPDVVAQLKAHGMTALSETRDLTPDVSQKILEKAL